MRILKSEETLKTWMREEGVESVECFDEWLKEEREYLLGLKAAPSMNEETLEMEYVQKLINYSASRCVYLFYAGLG